MKGQFVRLGDHANLLTGFPFKSDQYSKNEGGIRLLRGDNVAPGAIRWTNAKCWPPERAAGLEQYLLQKGDVVLAMDRPWIEGGLKFGAVGESDLPALLVQRVARLRGTTSLDGGFLRYLLASRAFTEHVQAVTTGTAIPHISGQQIKDFEFALPGFREQRAIASILGALDDKIELNRRMNQTLEAIARALFKSWFVDFDPVHAKMRGEKPWGMDAATAALFPNRLEETEGGIPEGWRSGSLADVAHLNPESWTAATTPDTVEYLDLSNVKRGRIDSVVGYSKSEAPSRAQRILRPGDTIVGTVRPGNGSYSLVSEDGLTGSTGFAVLRPRVQGTHEFVYLAATAGDNIERLQHLADGGAYPAVRPEVVATSRVVVPPESVLNAFSATTGPLMRCHAANWRESRTLAALRHALVPPLLSGELRVPTNQEVPA